MQGATIKILPEVVYSKCNMPIFILTMYQELYFCSFMQQIDESYFTGQPDACVKQITVPSAHLRTANRVYCVLISVTRSEAGKC